MHEYLALLPVLLPIVGAVLAAILDRYRKRIRYGFLVAFSAAILVLFTGYFIGIQAHYLEPLEYGWMIWDAPGAFIACLTAFIGLLVIVYSLTYRDRPHFDSAYFEVYFLLMGMMNGLACTYNVLILLIFLETATSVSAVLILFGRTKRAINATYIYLAISIIEVVLVVIGAFILYRDTGTMSLDRLTPGSIGQGDMFLLAMIFFFGFGTKAGLLPLGFIWLPPAHSEAPPPISATMSGVLIKASAIAMVKVIYPFYAMSGVETLALVVACFGVLNMFAGVIMALLSGDIKRLLAYHSISQMGYIILGIGLATPDSVYGAIFHITNHMLFKGCLFLITGALVLRIHTRKMDSMGGLLWQMPLTAACFLIASLAMSGVPFLNGFISKELIYEGTIQAGYPVIFSIFGTGLTVFAILGWITSLLTFICLIHAFRVIFLGKPKEELKNARDPPASMLLPIVVLAGLCIIIGIYPEILSGALRYVADALLTLIKI